MSEFDFSAPQMDIYRYLHRVSAFQTIELTEKSRALLAKIVEKLDALERTFENGWEFWVSVPVGTYEDYIKYVLEEDKLSKREYNKYKKSWRRDYPFDEYWYKITLVTERGYILMSLDDNVIIHIAPDGEKDPFTPFSNVYNYDKILTYLYKKVENLLEQVSSGEYNTFIKKSLPYEYREGVICRKDYWAIEPNNYKADLGQLTEKEVELFLSYAENEITSSVADSALRIEKMNVNTYYEYCAYCYKAAQFKDVEKMTTQEMCDRYIDRRDGGLRQIDADSYEIFDKWYSGDKHELEFTNGSHLWEISVGRTHTMIHLYLNKDERGYYLMLAGGIHTRRGEVVRMYNELKSKGIPVGWYGIEKIVKYYKGEDKIGFIPMAYNSFDYWYGGFRDKSVISFICFSDMKNKEKYIEKTVWFDEPELRLKQ